VLSSFNNLPRHVPPPSSPFPREVCVTLIFSSFFFILISPSSPTVPFLRRHAEAARTILHVAIFCALVLSCFSCPSFYLAHICTCICLALLISTVHFFSLSQLSVGLKLICSISIVLLLDFSLCCFPPSPLYNSASAHHTPHLQLQSRLSLPPQPRICTYAQC